MKKTLLHILLILILFISCKNVETTKELLIYTGSTMVEPMVEIVAVVEKEENCKIHIIKGGSGNLYQAIVHSKQGDLYLSGSESFIVEGINKDTFITDTVVIGRNRAVLMVQKGNPKKVTKDIDVLSKQELRNVLASTGGAIGQKTKMILDQYNTYEQYRAKSEYLVIDSEGLISALKEDKADVVINWFATCLRGDNRSFIDVIEIDSRITTEEKLVFGLLKYSKHPEIAKKIMNLARSKRGENIFKKHGF